jgi:hypothetical protein
MIKSIKEGINRIKGGLIGLYFLIKAQCYCIELILIVNRVVAGMKIRGALGTLNDQATLVILIKLTFRSGQGVVKQEIMGKMGQIGIDLEVHLF